MTGVHPSYRWRTWVQGAPPHPEPLPLGGRAWTRTPRSTAHCRVLPGVPRCPALGRPARLPPAFSQRASDQAATSKGTRCSGQTDRLKQPHLQMPLSPTSGCLWPRHPGSSCTSKSRGSRIRPDHFTRLPSTSAPRPGSPAECRACLGDNYSTGSKDLSRGHKSGDVSMETHKNACCFY